MSLSETALYKQKVHAVLDRKFPDGYVLTWLNDKQFSLQTSAPIFDKETNKQIGTVGITRPTCEMEFSEDDALLIVLATDSEILPTSSKGYHSWKKYENHPCNKKRSRRKARR